MPDPVPALYAFGAVAALPAAFFWLDVSRNAKGDRSPAKLGDAATFTAIALGFAAVGFLLSLIARF